MIKMIDLNLSTDGKMARNSKRLDQHHLNSPELRSRSRGGRGQRGWGRWGVQFVVWILLLPANVFKICQNTEVNALDGGIICNRIPGLVSEQRKLCRSYPDAMAAVGVGANLALDECRYQFRFNRWNCSSAKETDGPLHLMSTIGSKETAFSFAIRSAGVTYAITKACSQGDLSSCGCDKARSATKARAIRSPSPTPAPGGTPGPQSAATANGDPVDSGELEPATDWKWGGCSANIDYGLRFGRSFLDAMEISQDSRSLMNLHNNRAGRKALKSDMKMNCKCSGVSGSCTTKICWMTLPPFRSVGDHLALVYGRAKMVEPIRAQRAMKAMFLKLKRSAVPQKKPNWRELVFLHKSPSYCEFDQAAGSLGTQGRQCNRTSADTDGCEHMCCGRGFDARVQLITTRCKCKFHWCCYVTCEQCSELLEECRCR